MTEPSEISGAKHLRSRLTAESLQSREVLRATDGETVRRLLPDLTVIKLGGASIIDRGPEVLLPVIDQLAELIPDHRLLICAGEGARARHAYGIATDLGLPAGVLSIMGSSTAEQNALIIGALLLDHGAITVSTSQVPTLLNSGNPLVMSGMPPYEWWEPPPPDGRIPQYGSDAGSFLIGEAFGARTVIYVKDQDGLYDRDPASGPGAQFIEQAAAAELLAAQPADLPLEPMVIEMLAAARVVQRLQLINGVTAGTILQAVRGEPVGSVITAE
jgi:molybdenum storage protein